MSACIPREAGATSPLSPSRVASERFPLLALHLNREALRPEKEPHRARRQRDIHPLDPRPAPCLVETRQVLGDAPDHPRVSGSRNIVLPRKSSHVTLCSCPHEKVANAARLP